MEVARIPRHGGQAALDVFQHQIVFRLINNQSGVDAADDQVVRQKVLLFIERRYTLALSESSVTVGRTG